MAKNPTEKNIKDEFEETGKTMPFVPRGSKESESTDFTRSSLYPLRNRLPSFLKNPVVIFSLLLVLLIGLVFSLLYGLGGAGKPQDTTASESTADPAEKDPAPWRVEGLLEAETIAAGNIHSQYGIVVDLDSMQAIAGKNMNGKMYPASMTKIMTFIVAYENMSDPEALLEVSASIKNQYPDASRVGIDVGDLMSAEQCLWAMILESDTDAVLMLCEYVAGSEAAFAMLMNEKAMAMGLAATHFTNATGLHHDDHYTTVCEMAEILAYAMDIPLFAEIATSYSYRTNLKYYKDGTLTDYSMTFFNTTLRNRFENLGVSTSLTGGGKILGGKTGFTDEGAYCQAAIAEGTDGKLYIAILGKASKAERSAKDTRYVFNTYIK